MEPIGTHEIETNIHKAEYESNISQVQSTHN